MSSHRRPYTFDRVVRMTLTTVVIVGLIWLLNYLSDVLVPFVVAFLLAYLLNPLVDWIQKRVRNRLASILIALFGVSLVGVGLCLWLVPVVVGEIKHMIELLVTMATDPKVAARFAAVLPEETWEQIRAWLADRDLPALLTHEQTLPLIQETLKKLTPGVWGVVTGTASFLLGLTGLALVLLYVVFLLLDYQKLIRQWPTLIPPSYRGEILGFVGEFNRAMHRHFRAQSMIAVSVGVLFAIGFGLIDLPMGVVFGLTVGVFNMVPYLQLMTIPPACALAIVRALESNESVLWAVVAVLIVYAIVQTIQDALLTPRFQGKATGLSPAMILLSLTVWGKLLGLLGVVIALPMTCLALAYYRRLVLERQATAELPAAVAHE